MEKLILENLQMNIIKNKTSNLFILFIFLLACNQEYNNKLQTVKITFSNEWKVDTFGCLGKREKIITDSIKAIKNCEGINSKNFIEKFGNPNSIKKVGNEKYCLYWVTCGIKPIIKNNNNTTTARQINTGATELIVIINNQEIISEIKLIVP